MAEDLKTTKPLPQKPSPAIRQRGLCDCGEPLRRDATIDGSGAITEQALLCKRCRQFFERVKCFETEEIQPIEKPEWSKEINAILD